MSGFFLSKEETIGNLDAYQELYPEVPLQDAHFFFDEVQEAEGWQGFVRRLLAGISKPSSTNKIFNELKSSGVAISKNSVYELLDHLEAIYLFLPLPKFTASVLQESLAPPKHYCIDNGLRTALHSSVSEDKGIRLENAVFLHLRSTRLLGRGLHYFAGKHECDFVCSERGRVSALYQVCHSIEDLGTRKREVDGLLEAADTTGCKNLWILTSDEEMELEEAGRKIVVCPAWKWMLGE
jgi:predicted AAA+ superfamily ATPase